MVTGELLLILVNASGKQIQYFLTPSHLLLQIHQFTTSYQILSLKIIFLLYWKNVYQNNMPSCTPIP